MSSKLRDFVESVHPKTLIAVTTFYLESKDNLSIATNISNFITHCHEDFTMIIFKMKELTKEDIQILSVSHAIKIFMRVSKIHLFSSLIAMYHRYQEEKNAINNAFHDENMKIVNNYYKIKDVTEGHFGKIYKAINKDKHELVIIRNLKMTEKVKSEIDHLQLIKDNCPDYFSCLIESIVNNNQVYLVMEYLQNYIPLDILIRENYSFLEANFSSIVSKLCLGLQYLHSIDITHGDINSTTIIIHEETAQVKYGFSYRDIGISMSYLSPSLYHYKIKRLDIPLQLKKEADMWALGCVIYESIMKYPPYYFFRRSLEQQSLEHNEGVLNVYYNSYTYMDDPNRQQIEHSLRHYSCAVNLQLLLTNQPPKKKINTEEELRLPAIK